MQHWNRYPLVKVCGVTRLSDLDELARAGADTVGFNFVARSPRVVDVARAITLCARAKELGLIRVGVVMDMQADQLADLLTRIDIDAIQFHGRESPSMAERCGTLPIIKATSWSGRVEEHELVAAWRPLADLGRVVAWLVDAYAPVAGGGTGRQARWDLLKPRPPEFGKARLILAGGLTPDNVSDAVASAGVDGVDTASGVELAAGLKATELVQRFCTNSRLALAATGQG